MISERFRSARQIAPVALLLGAVLTVTGCAAGTVEPTPTDTKAPTVTEITDQPGSVEGFVGALEDAEVKRCERDGDGWVAAGTVDNPTDRTQSYRLYISAMADGDTRGIVQVDVASVAAGESAAWKAEFALPDNDLTCVLRVERFPAE